MIHSELIFMMSIKSRSRFIFFKHVNIQLLQHHLLKKLSLLQCITFFLLSNISWSYLLGCGADSGVYLWTLICSFILGKWLEDGFIFSIKLIYGLCDICFSIRSCFHLFPDSWLCSHMVVLLGIWFADKWKFPLLVEISSTPLSDLQIRYHM